MELPPELICEILYYLANKEYLHCCCASQLFNVLTTREHFERTVTIHVDYISLDHEERRHFAQLSYQHLIG